MSENGSKVIAAVHEVAAEQPDRVYEGSCVYVVRRNDEPDHYVPGCLIGQGLWRVGLIGPDFYRSTHNEDFIRDVAEILKLGFDTKEIDWLSDVQFQQDNKMPWGMAVVAADKLELVKASAA